MSGYNVNVRTLIRNRYNELDGRQVIQGNFNQLSCDTLIFENMTGNVGYFNNLNVESFTGSSISVNGDLSLTGGNINIYGSVNMTGGYYNYNGVPINNSFYPALSEALAVNSVSTWQLRSHISNKELRGCCWSPKLGIFVVVSSLGTGDRVLTSPNGIDWTARTSAADYFWRSVCWSEEQNKFVAVSSSGTGDRVMTSSDGITWNLQTTPADYEWTCVIWVKELSIFVAVAQSGSGNRVMTSPDGITWNLQTTPADYRWRSVCWSPELSLLVAVAESGAGNRVMTSPNGIVWTTQVTPEDLDYQSVCWSSELALFVAVAGTGTTGRVITSKDGINWTLRTSILSYWNSVVWSPQFRIFVAVAQSGQRLMYSNDGINWTGVTISTLIDYNNICWSPELSLFVTVGERDSSATTLIATSSLAGRIPTSFNVFDSSFNNINELGLWNFQSFGRGTPVTVLSSPYTIANGNNWIIVNNTGGNTTLTFPTASSWSGREIMIKTIQNRSVLSASSNIIPLHTTTATGTVLNATGGNWANLVSDGTNWVTMQGRL